MVLTSSSKAEVFADNYIMPFIKILFRRLSWHAVLWCFQPPFGFNQRVHLVLVGRPFLWSRTRGRERWNPHSVIVLTQLGGGGGNASLRGISLFQY